jgi:hypothetical protein
MRQPSALLVGLQRADRERVGRYPRIGEEGTHRVVAAGAPAILVPDSKQGGGKPTGSV